MFLCQNLYEEWFNNIVINKELTVVLNNDNINDTFDYVKKFCSEKLPFGIADRKKYENSYSNQEIIDYYKNAALGKNVRFEDLLRNEKGVFLKFSLFVSPNESMRFFYYLQKQRRIWYRKFSTNPERYSITDIKNEENCARVDIFAKYPWGNQILETIVINKQDSNYTNEQLQFKDRNKYVSAHTISSQVNLTVLLLNALCDCFEESSDKSRSSFKFHRKLAPYKLSFAITGASTSINNELNDLAFYMCKQIRNVHISTLYLPTASKNTLEFQYKQYDELGIPYTIVLNERTLKDGVVNLRSRDTTLKEQVHVSDLITYIQQIFQNY